MKGKKEEKQNEILQAVDELFASLEGEKTEPTRVETGLSNTGGSGDEEESLPAKSPAALSEEIERYRQEAEEYKDRWLRAVAELENFRKRVAKEKEEQIRYGNENVLREMILIVDNLERAFNHANKSSNTESILEGIRKILDQFTSSLKKFGVEQIQAKGVQFDPHLHEAVMQVEAAGMQPNTIVEELQKGYLLNNRLLRPAKVVVAKLPEGKND